MYIIYIVLEYFVLECIYVCVYTLYYYYYFGSLLQKARKVVKNRVGIYHTYGQFIQKNFIQTQLGQDLRTM